MIFKFTLPQNDKLKTYIQFLGIYFHIFSLMTSCSETFMQKDLECPTDHYRDGQICVPNSAKSATSCVDIEPSNVRKGTTYTRCNSEVATGTAIFPSSCSKDGELECLANSSFPSVKLSEINEAYYSDNISIGGKTGTKKRSKICKNMGSISIVDAASVPSNLANPGSTGFPTAPASFNTGNDRITFTKHELSQNSILRFATSGTLPAPLVAATDYYAIPVDTDTFSVASTANGSAIDITTQGTGMHRIVHMGDGVLQYWDNVTETLSLAHNETPDNPWSNEEFRCDSSNFVDVTSNTAPFKPTLNNPPTIDGVAANFNKIYQDKLTGMYVTNPILGFVYNWAEVVKYCTLISSQEAGSGWRVPTHKELMQLYVNGYSKIAWQYDYDNGSSSFGYFSSTISTSDYGMFLVNLMPGVTFSALGRGMFGSSVICVRE